MMRFALVGCGKIGERHAKYIHEFASLVALCDTATDALQTFAHKYPQATTFTDFTTMLTQIDADVVSICTPNGEHANQALAALESGFHVLVEKPMAIHSADAKLMIATAERVGRKLFVVKQNRFNPPVVAVKNALESGTLGKILSVQVNCFWNRNEAYYNNSWRGSQQLDGGTLYTQFSHFIDLIYWLAGPMQEVKAFTNNAQHQGVIDFEDQGVVCFNTNSGALGTIHFTVNAYAKNMEGSIALFCEKGTVKIGGQYLNELEYQSIDNFVFENLPIGNGPNNYGAYVGSMSNHDVLYKTLVTQFHQPPAIIAGADALHSVIAIEKIYAAATYQKHCL
ncbi:MAG TPA: gfo/Idh/MocA family oxidoreductase [Chitinophagaceae bacterium]|nr:gfo/Idh/MocA family oxidoreductase [Chitinophagaceae bacterium]HAN38053.1 gfo/Idh/MocA family oxidoreductase [Chitinophagaceae bacterium]